MPRWMPTSDKLRRDIETEYALLEAEVQWKPSVSPTVETAPISETLAPNIERYIPQMGTQIPDLGIEETELYTPEWQPRVSTPEIPQVPLTSQIETSKVTAPAVKPAAKYEVLPFWQRAIGVFTAPFRWVDENIIKPGLGITATTVGLKEVERLPGEDYFEWKKRSWESWQSPGINMNVPWSKDPVRIDLKGVLEFAPWLLIPGAGQVGTGVRAGVGVAGALGKLGTAGKALGYAVQYSPWGVAEKVAGTVIKGTLGKGAEAITKLEQKVFGKIPPKPVLPSVEKLTKFFDEQVVPARKAFQKELPSLRAKQANAVNEIWERVRSGKITAEEGTKLAEKATAGGIKQYYALKGGQFAKEDVEELLGEIVKSSEKGLVERDADISLRDLLLNGSLPEPHHIKQFARIFGDKFASSVSKISGVKPTLREQIVDFFNLPRAVLASTDLSGTARQGLILGLTHPSQVPRAFVRQIKSLFSEKLSQQSDDLMRSDPLFREFTEVAGGYIAPIEKAARLTAREETFMSRTAEHLPFVRRSERAFITYLNELRFGVYKQVRASIMATGGGNAELQTIGRFINLASGRGDLPANLNRLAPVLNTLVFSPRLQMATLELPIQIGKMLTSKNPYIRKEAAKALVTFVGGGASLLLLLKQSGAAEVEFDPRSVDFGKIKIGDTRLDIWRGYVQYARFLANILTGERMSAFGNLSKARRDEVAWRFLQSKSSPAFGLLIDVLRGENYAGEPLFEGTTGAIKSARERLFPLALQDIIEATEQSGVNGLWTAAPAVFGVGVLTYTNDLVNVKNKIAQDIGFKAWSEIDPKTRREIENTNVELQTAQIKFDRDVMGTQWGDWRVAGNAVEEVFRDNVEKAVAQFRATKDGYNFREKVNDAFKGRRNSYKAREKDIRFEEVVARMNTKDTAEAIVKLTPEQLAIKVYNEALYGDDMYDEFGDYRFDLADERKQVLRQELGALYDYVEEYQNMKYDTFPAEFQELARARTVLKPYWEVADKIEKAFGKAFAESRTGQSFIQKQRKILRLTDPNVAKYYEMFYAKV